MDKREKEMIHEMYAAYKVQCGFLKRLKEIHEEWNADHFKDHCSVVALLDKVHKACQVWYKSRVEKGKEK